MKAAKIPAVDAHWENPLIPNKLLRELYTAMAELRLLEESLSKLHRHSMYTPGEEACRASTALSLLPGDMTSDNVQSAATSFLRGAKLADLIPDSKAPNKPTGYELPFALDPERRLLLAIGAALALATKKAGRLVLAYLDPGELELPDWKPLFRLAASHAAPILFVALPSTTAAAKRGRLSEVSTSASVPGIPVDAADAVALYRVTQESMLRSRAGGGPVLIECIPFQVPGKTSAPSDAILNMRDSLLQRNIADEAWFTSTEARFKARLIAAGLR